MWHYQTTPGDAWDYTATTQHMILADLEIDGAIRQVIMQAPKNGFYVIDRVTGEFISGENFVPITWADGIDPETGRPNILDSAKYWETGEVSLQSPSFLGGHNWHPMSFNPETGLVYFPAQEISFPYIADNAFEPKALAANLGIDTKVARLPDDPEVIAAVKAGNTWPFNCLGSGRPGRTLESSISRPPGHEVFSLLPANWCFTALQPVS